jgi:hypothetical protein
MNAAQMAAALENHDRVRKSTEIPLFYGIVEKDVISPEQFIRRINNAAIAANWNEARKLVEMYNCLRGPATEWWDYIADEPGIDQDNWDIVSANFLASQTPKATAHLHTASLAELHIKPGETETQFQGRVNTVFREINRNRGPIANVAACDNYYKKLHFIAGLSPEVRDKVMEHPRATFEAACIAAREAAVILKNARVKKIHAILGVDPELCEQADLDENPAVTEEMVMEINAVRARANRRPLRWKPRSTFSRRPGPSSSASAVSSSASGEVCRFCKRAGHRQKECRSRIAAKAPMVDQHGKPYRSQGRVQAVQEEENHPAPASSTVHAVEARSMSDGPADVYHLNW